MSKQPFVLFAFCASIEAHLRLINFPGKRRHTLCKYNSQKGSHRQDGALSHGQEKDRAPDAQVMLMRRFVQEFLQVLLPYSRVSVGAVTVSFVGNRQQNEASMLYPPDFTFGNAKFRRIDEVIGGIDEHDVREDLV
jgi:hypothetical protein